MDSLRRDLDSESALLSGAWCIIKDVSLRLSYPNHNHVHHFTSDIMMFKFLRPQGQATTRLSTLTLSSVKLNILAQDTSFANLNG